MKISRLKLKNINALQGTWEIDFEQPPLADARLFAIVGPNGSGKTSILDAITLALYGETPRMKDPESKSLHSDNGSAYAEVVFSVGGRQYRSRWATRRVDGKLDEPQMSIASLNGQEAILEDRITKVRTLVAELTGLDFKRFCRSILLAQGEFTAFLNALENERAEILERIIGPGLTNELTESIHSQAEAEHEKLLRLKEAAESISAPGKETVRAVEEALERVREDLRETEGLVEELGKQEERFGRLEALISDEQSAADEVKLAESRAAQRRAQFDSMVVTGNVEPFRQDIKRLDELQTEAGRARTLLEEYESDIESYKRRIEELEKAATVNRQEMEAARRRLDDRREDIDAAQQLDYRIQAQKAQMEELTGRHQALEHSLGEKLQQRSEIERRIEELKRHSENVQHWLKKHVADANLGTELPAIRKTLTRLKEVRDRIDERETQLRAAREDRRQTADILKNTEKSAQKAEKKIQALTVRQEAQARHLEMLLGADTLELLKEQYRGRKSRLSTCRKLAKMARKYWEQTQGEDIFQTLERIRVQKDELVAVLSPEETRLAALEGEARWREAIKGFESERLLLQPGTACPLCGALDHPFVETGSPDFKAANEELQAQRTKVKALQSELNALDSRAKRLEPQATAAEKIREEWTRTCAQVNAERDIMSPESFDGELRSSVLEVRQLRSRIRIIRWRAWWASRGNRILQKKTEKLSAKTLTRDQLQKSHQLQLRMVDNLETELKNLREDEQKEKEAAQSALYNYGESFPKAGMEMAFKENIEHRLAEYRRQVKEQDSSTERLASLEIDGKALTPEITRLKEEAASSEAELEAAKSRLAEMTGRRSRLFKGEDAIEESRNITAQIDRCSQEEYTLNQEKELSSRALYEREADLLHMSQEARKMEAEADREEQEILKQAVSSGFKSTDEMRSALRVMDEREAIVDQLHSAETALAEARSKAVEAHTAVESIRTELAAAETIETIGLKLDDAAKRRDSLQRELEAAQVLLQQYSEAEQHKQTSLQAVAEQEKIWALMAAEEETLKSRDQAEVQGKLHRMMLERLLERTNRNLEELSGRYYLRPVSEEGFSLQVEDVLQGGALRSTKTLSGGESFIVSLCLSLGLSEMANRDRKIESLFLDEGFGALDDEMLYRVIVALKALRSNGKMVGVISHVKRLADEIPTQIRVEKQPGGRSRISIVA